MLGLRSGDAKSITEEAPPPDAGLFPVWELDQPIESKQQIGCFVLDRTSWRRMAEHERAWAKFDDGLPPHEGFRPEDQDFDDPSLHQ